VQRSIPAAANPPDLLPAAAPVHRRHRDLTPFWFLLPATIFLLALTVVPAVTLLYNSLRDWSLIYPTRARFVGLGNYVRLLQDERVHNALVVTVFYTAAAVVLQTVLGVGIALLVDREFRGRSLARGLLLLPLITTPVVVALTWRMLYDPTFGMVNYLLRAVGLPGPSWLADATLALPAVVLVDVWEWTPFVVLVALAGLQSVPPDLIEAASIDGASWFQTLTAILLPVIRPVILVAVLFRTMDTLRSLDTVYVLTNGGPGTSTETLNMLGYLTSFKFLEMGYGAALAVVILIAVTLASQLLVNATGLERE